MARSQSLGEEEEEEGSLGPREEEGTQEEGTGRQEQKEAPCRPGTVRSGGGIHQNLPPEDV